MKSIRRCARSVFQNRLFWIVALIITAALISGSAILLFERVPGQEGFESLGDGIWWAVVTMTTVGYGDRYPVTTPGRVIGVVLMFSSIVLVSLFTATVSSIFWCRTSSGST